MVTNDEQSNDLAESLVQGLEAIGVDNYTIDITSTSVFGVARPIIERVFAFFGESAGKIVSLSILEHSRGYRDSLRFELRFVISIPRQKQASILRKKSKDPSADRNALEGDSGRVQLELGGDLTGSGLSIDASELNAKPIGGGGQEKTGRKQVDKRANQS